MRELGQLATLRDISNGRIADLQEELSEARAAAAGAARGAELTAAIERDRPPSRGLLCIAPEPESEPEDADATPPLGPPPGGGPSLSTVAGQMLLDGSLPGIIARNVRPREAP